MSTSRVCCNLTKPPRGLNQLNGCSIHNIRRLLPTTELFLLVKWEEGTHSIVSEKDIDGDASSLKKGDVTRVKFRKEWYEDRPRVRYVLYVCVQAEPNCC